MCRNAHGKKVRQILKANKGAGFATRARGEFVPAPYVVSLESGHPFYPSRRIAPRPTKTKAAILAGIITVPLVAIMSLRPLTRFNVSRAVRRARETREKGIIAAAAAARYVANEAGSAFFFSLLRV